MYSSLLQLENLCRILDSFAMEYEALFILLILQQWKPIPLYKLLALLNPEKQAAIAKSKTQ